MSTYIKEQTTPSRAWYAASIDEFLGAQPQTVLGRLAQCGEFTLIPTQRDAWIRQISILQECLSGLSGAIFLEFNIPRMGRRIDAVLLVGPVVFVVEFKVGEFAFHSAGRDQVWDYALDLKNFHEASHNAPKNVTAGATVSITTALLVATALLSAASVAVAVNV